MTRKLKMNAALTESCKTSSTSSGIHRIAYAAFVVVALYFLIFSDDKMNGISQLAIALIFDPFDQTVPFQKRPLFQRIWLMVHCLVVLGGFVFLLWVG